ncbi:MAG: polysaccharide biosynthesis tyrosine autokinase [Bacteroidales bacterium]|nr:polysaccharide biosynthesis tyrosine autokinase [Bacteroidales bacterium]
MEEYTIQNPANNITTEAEENSTFNLQNIMSIFILNWKWFIFSVIICLAISIIYIRYKTPTYQANTKIFIQDNDSKSSAKGALLEAENLGFISNSNGIDNEIEIIASHSIAQNAVKELKLYTTYKIEGSVKNKLIYGNQPLNVDLDESSLEVLKFPIKMEINYKNGKYNIKGKYTTIDAKEGEAKEHVIKKSISTVPAKIPTSVGNIQITANPKNIWNMEESKTLYVTITPPKDIADIYVNKITVEPTNKTSSIVLITINDENQERALDYLTQLVKSYNEEANADKNTIAIRTEEFINSRLEKISQELGETENELESYKRRSQVFEVNANAVNAMTQTNTYDQQLAEINTQLSLLSSIKDYMSIPQNKYQTLPSNVGLTDPTASALISQYNQIALDRSRLMRTASENSPTVIPLTGQLDVLTTSINNAIIQAQKNLQIQRNAIKTQFAKYNTQIQESPSQERILNRIGRQQEVSSGLYLMLLQKHEENSISLAATANKGKIIDEPNLIGKIAPKEKTIILMAIVLGIAIPFGIFILIQLMRYKIEVRDDVEKLTKLPISGDIPVASETVKSKSGIVVHENTNNMITEVFRSLRTNVLFTMKEKEKVIMVTSSTASEGKTFIASNLGISLALLGKKVIIVGLDIRKPRLAELFGVNDKIHGITPLLTKDNVCEQDVRDNIVNSGANRNLDVLFAGPIPPNPAELVTRETLDEVFDHLKNIYDYIIIDTPPVGIVTDTLSIARLADATLCICRADYTPKAAFSYINQLAAEEKLTNVSIAINGIDFSKKTHSYTYGYGKYGNYGKYGSYGRYGNYGSYGNYANSHYGSPDDNSVKK